MNEKQTEETKITQTTEKKVQKKRPSGNKKKKAPGRIKISLAKRIKLAYILILSISVLLIALLMMIPRHSQDDRERTKDRAPAEEPYTERPEDLPEREEGPSKVGPDVLEPEEEESAAEEEVPLKGVLYLVIDDVGYSLSQLENFLAIPVPITYAILPRLDHTVSSYRRIVESGNDVILHQPMEPLGDQDPGPGALYVNMPPESIKTILNENLDQLPEAVGMNNHMGSKGTSDEFLMDQVMSEIRNRKRDFYFLDSRTTAETIVEKVAEEHRVFHSGRNVFLDNVSEKEAIKAALESALKIAEEKGSVVMIGHVWSEELAANLDVWYEDIRKRGFIFSHLSSFFSREEAHAGIGG